MMINRDQSVGGLHPELLKYWHPEKNGDKSPYLYLPKSRVMVWWLCPDGHEFQCSIVSAVKGLKCPKCNSLAVKFPDLSKQWHPEKNGPLTPYDVSPKSDIKAWWLCDNGHEWEAQIKNRSNGNGCPYCAGQKASMAYNLAVLHPDIAAQWHPDKNGEKKPEQFTPGSKEEIWWQCDKLHEWVVRINVRTAGTGCPYCSGQYACHDNSLAKLYPKIAEEWDYENNGDLTPDQVRPGSDDKVAWKCLKKGHTWNEKIYKRISRGYNCPYCSGKRVCSDNCLANVDPDLAKEWNPVKNGEKTPEQFTVSSGEKVWWQCDKQHEWMATIASRSSGRCCPKCRPNVSRLELRIYAELSYYSSDAEQTAKPHNLEVDVFLPQHGLGVEVDGYRWHKDKVKFDEMKTETLRQHGIRLIRLREAPLPLISADDIQYKKEDDQIDVVQSLLRELLTLGELTDTEKKAIKDGIEQRTFNNEALYAELFSNRFSPPEGKSFSDMRPELVNEWDYEKNAGLLPKHFYIMSDEKVYWKCHKGHSWLAQIKSRAKGSQCPYCVGRLPCEETCLATTDPRLAAQWHPTKNGELTPKDVTQGSGKRVWWLCKNGHAWPAPVYSRSSGNNCAACARKGKRDNYI